MTEYFAGPEVFTGNLVIVQLSQELVKRSFNFVNIKLLADFAKLRIRNT